MGAVGQLLLDGGDLRVELALYGGVVAAAERPHARAQALGFAVALLAHQGRAHLTHQLAGWLARVEKVPFERQIGDVADVHRTPVAAAQDLERGLEHARVARRLRLGNRWRW